MRVVSIFSTKKCISVWSYSFKRRWMNSALLWVQGALCHGQTEGREAWVLEGGRAHAWTQRGSCACKSSGSSTCGGHFWRGLVGKNLRRTGLHADSAGLECLAVNGWLLRAVVRELARFGHPFWTCFHMHFVFQAHFRCMCCYFIHLLLFSRG